MLILFGAITWRALEGGEVVVLHTLRPDGSVHETRVWIAEDQGELRLEAGTPENPWYQHILVRPELDVTRDGRRAPFRALPEPGSEGHERIRRLFREKYGWADAWVGLLQDGSGSVLVRLEPAGNDLEHRADR